MMARRNGHGPTDEHGDDAELAGTTQVVGEYDYDTATVDEVEQAETGYPDRPIPVEVVAPVRVDELPVRSGGMFTRSVAQTPTRATLSANPLRKAATIIPLDGDVRIGTSQGEALANGSGAILPAGVPLVTTLADDIWIGSAVAATAQVSVFVEHWSR